MKTQHLLSGSITFRSRKIPIIWSGQMAQHVAENYIHQNSTHPLLHVAIQQIATRIRNWDKGTKSVYKGYGDYNGINVVVIIEVKATFALIKSCFKGKENMKNSEISGIIDELGLAYPDHIYQELVDLGMYRTFEEAKERLDKSTYERNVKPFLKKPEKKKASKRKLRT